MSGQGQLSPSKLRWRCRRGMQELDVLLTAWLESHWADAPEQLQAAFEKLLECEDDRIWYWLMGRDCPEPALVQIVEEIRETGIDQTGG